jgi:hypothetical protein
MGMNPRTLRPGSTFTPRSISGLALWLDAADGSSLFQSDAAGASPVAAPTDIAGCIGWWDASDAGTITADPTTKRVSQWAGKVGGKHFTQPTTASQPLLEEATLGGRNVIRLNAAAQMTVANDKTTWNSLHQSGGSGGWVFVVLQPFNTTSTEQWGRFLATDGWQSINAGFNVFLDDRASLGQSGSVRCGISRAVGGSSAADSINNTTVPIDTAAYITSLRFDPNNATAQERLRLFVNGVGGNNIVINSGAASSANASADLSLGLAGQSTTGFVAEIIIYGAMLSYTDRARVEAYLAAKWGISGVHAQATATNDPVGCWRDKSGNNRHATQATGANRATLSTASLNAKPTISNNGTGAVSLATPSWAYTSANTAIAVFRGNAINQGVYQRGNLNDQPRMAIQQVPLAVCATRGGTISTQTTSNMAYTASQWAIAGTLFNTSLGQAYRDGVYGTATTDSQTFSGDYPIRLLSLPTNIYGLNGGIAEFIYYDRQLSAAEVLRVSRYLAAKWGITLAPQVSNADAQDWINRVYANGGTVSSTTATAVNTFCNAIDEANIRDRFYRLNLFCGTADASLIAVRTPLYRGQSLGGTQFGNTLDTNVNFAITDYAETGASGGLLGNAASKYLDTGFNASAAGLTTSSVHMSAVWTSYAHPANGNWFPLSIINAAVNERFWLNPNANSTPTTEVTSTIGQANPSLQYQIAATNGATIPGGLWTASRTSTSAFAVYEGATSRASSSTLISTASLPSTAMTVFVRWNGTAFFGYSGQRLRAYSVGLGMDAGQVQSFNSAMTTFQAALGRV